MASLGFSYLIQLIIFWSDIKRFIWNFFPYDKIYQSTVTPLVPWSFGEVFSREFGRS